MDNELIAVLEQFKQAIDWCREKIDYMDKVFEDFKNENDERIHSLESTLYDEIINPTKEYIAEEEKNARFADFDSKYGEKLRPFNEPLSVLEGKDFDIVRSAFDQYDDYEDENKMDTDTYVDRLVEEVGNQLEEIKRGLGLPEDAEIEVKQTEDGETVVEVEDEGDNEEEIIVSEDGDSDEELNEEDSEIEDDPDEVAAFEEELKSQA